MPFVTFNLPDPSSSLFLLYFLSLALGVPSRAAYFVHSPCLLPISPPHKPREGKDFCLSCSVSFWTLEWCLAYLTNRGTWSNISSLQGPGIWRQSPRKGSQAPTLRAATAGDTSWARDPGLGLQCWQGSRTLFPGWGGSPGRCMHALLWVPVE